MNLEKKHRHLATHQLISNVKNFGHAIEAFSTIPLSLNTCAEMLLGEIGLNEQLIEQSFIIPPLLFQHIQYLNRSRKGF